MEISIQVFKEKWSCWEKVFEYTSTHIPRVGERIDIGIGTFEVKSIVHRVAGDAHVELYVEY